MSRSSTPTDDIKQDPDGSDPTHEDYDLLDDVPIPEENLSDNDDLDIHEPITEFEEESPSLVERINNVAKLNPSVFEPIIEINKNAPEPERTIGKKVIATRKKRPTKIIDDVDIGEEELPTRNKSIPKEIVRRVNTSRKTKPLHIIDDVDIGEDEELGPIIATPLYTEDAVVRKKRPRKLPHPRKRKVKNIVVPPEIHDEPVEEEDEHEEEDEEDIEDSESNENSKLAKKKKQNYTDTDLILAVAEVKSGGMKVSAAARKYKIPTSTLCDRLSGKYEPFRLKSGPLSRLPQYEEAKLASYLLHRAKIGNGVRKYDLSRIITRIFDESSNDTGVNLNVNSHCFSKNTPSKFWIYRFLKRHPELASTIPDGAMQFRRQVTLDLVGHWFEGMKKYFKEEWDLNAEDFFQEKNANQIYCTNKMIFPISSDNKLVQITDKTMRKSQLSGEAQISLLACSASNGRLLKPFIIRPESEEEFNKVDETKFGTAVSSSGALSSDSFFAWLVGVFYESIEDKTLTPIILLMDSRTVDVNFATIQFCEANKILIYCFPPYSNSIMQPIDLSVLTPIKRQWNRMFQNLPEGYPLPDKKEFFEVFGSIWDEIENKRDSICECFTKVGLMPYNPETQYYLDFLSCKSDADLNKPFSNAEELEVANNEVFRDMEMCITPKNLDQFRKLYDNSDEINDGSNLSQLWSIYKTLRTRVQDQKDLLDDSVHEDNPLDEH